MSSNANKSSIGLIAFNARWTHSNLALYYVDKILHEQGIESTIFEFSINQPSWEIWKILSMYHFKVIAVSVYIWNASVVKAFLTDLKKIYPDVILLLAGPEVSYQAAWWIERFPQIDHIIVGNGEFVFRNLIISNFRSAPRIIQAESSKLAELPFPHNSAEMIDLHHKFIYYESSRGCQYRCSYCLSSRKDHQIEAKPIEQVKDELRFYISEKAKIVKFVDRTFNYNRKRAQTIWEYLIQQQTNTVFHFEIHPQLLTKQEITFLQSVPSDRFQFEIGIQTLCYDSLKAIHRSQVWSDIKPNILSLIQKTKIPIHVDLIFGLPFETMRSFQHAFNEVYQLGADQFQLGFLKVLPGTEMKAKESEYRLKYQTQAPYHILQNKWISFSDVLFWKDIESLLNIFYNSHKFEKTIQELAFLYDSAYELYSALQKYWEENQFDLKSKQWQINAFRIFSFIKKNSIEKADFLIDCLRWDWAKIANGHFYPNWLKNESSYALKKRLLPLIKKEFANSSYYVQSAIFLSVNTIDFSKKHGKTLFQFAFLKTKQKKIVFGIRQDDTITRIE